MPGQARLSVRQSPLIRGRFSFQSKGPCGGRRAGVKTGPYHPKPVCFPVSLHVPAGTPCRRENRAGLPADAGAFLVAEAVESVWRRGLDLDGSRTVLGARGSDFRFPTEAPGQPWYLAHGEGGDGPAMQEPQEIEDEEYEQLVARVAAIDVAKASGMVCTRVPHASAQGRRSRRCGRSRRPPARSSSSAVTWRAWGSSR